MEQIISNIGSTRQNFIDIIDQLSLEQINEIPEGFNNNIIWNFAHVVAAQQLLCYKLAGVAPVVDDNFIDLFKKGTKPESFIDQDKVEHIKKLSILTLDKFKLDIKDGIFGGYQQYVTSYGIPLNNIEDAVNFVSIHEGLHLGYVWALRRLVTK